MPQINRPTNIHAAYHAHVYFDLNELDNVVKLTEEIEKKFNLVLGNIHKKPVGPHTTGSRQIKFLAQHFNLLIPWLDRNRGSLSILIHGVTGNDLQDHTDFAYWLGNPVPLDLTKLKELP